MSKEKDSNKKPPPPNGGWGIPTDDGKLVTNFMVEIIAIVDTYSSVGSKPVTNLKLRLDFGDGQVGEEFTELKSKLKKIDWVEKDVRCLLYPNVSEPTAHRYITSHVQERLRNAPRVIQYKLNRLGVQVIEDEPVYCAGGEVIRPPHDGNASRTNIEPAPMPYSLDYDPNISAEEAVFDTLELISLFPDFGRMIFVYNLVYFLRELYVYAWKAPQFCLYPYGLTGSQKTTICAFISQLYNRSKGIKPPPRFDTSIAQSVRIIYAQSDSVIVFDDLCPSDLKDVQRYQERLFSKIVRMIGDGMKPGRFNVKELDVDMPPPASGVLMTGEYLLVGAESDLARFLPVEVAPLSHEARQRLKEFIKDKPLVISTLYRNFIQWFINKYNWAKEFLMKWWDAYSDSDFTEHYGQKIHDRFRETHYYLNTAYIMFLQYCAELGCITEEEAKAMQQSFLMLITDLILDQQSRVDQSKRDNISEAKINYLDYFRKQYLGKVFKLAPSAKEFNKAVHDGVEQLGRLYIYGERFREIVDAAGFNMDEVLDDLKAQGALYHDKDLNTTKLVVSQKNKPRCYAIYLTHLK